MTTSDETVGTTTKKNAKKKLLDVKSGGQTHHPTNLLSEECGNTNDLFKTSMLRH